MIDPAILKKIRKCLALSKSANEHEAAAALAKAKAIMADHGIDEAMLAMAEIEEHAARGTGAMKPAAWESILVMAVEHALNVMSFIDTDASRRFVGRGPLAEIASYSFLVLFRQLKAARKAYISTKLRRCSLAGKRARADVFSQGWASVVYRKIAAMAPRAPIDDALTNYLVVQHPGLVPVGTREAKINNRNAHDYWNGAASGRQANLNQGVGGAEAQRLLA